jgi:UDP-N-acetylmuramate: L-alanyl-gamma-D-glutamyl-meso-diaminopimelate ligase
LELAGIEIYQGYDAQQLDPAPELVIVGNAMSRGNPAVEAMLDRAIPYTSGPQWLGETLLAKRWVLAVSGTHGKTTTASMLAWILEYAGFNPGYLIGGVPQNFDRSARLGDSDFFVIEADEYDTAFFDKRSKFLHYHARTLVINNLEFDHADIFPDLAAIQTQFHHLLRTVPSIGTVLFPTGVDAITEVVERGLWSQAQQLGEDWQVQQQTRAGDRFVIQYQGEQAQVHWSLLGEHNIANGLAAVAAAKTVGVELATACEALSCFAGVKRRLELLANVAGVSVYDDFAHHPTAIATTLTGLRRKVGAQPIIACIELRSNTMRSGVHAQELAEVCSTADRVLWFQADDYAAAQALAQRCVVPAQAFASVDALVEALVPTSGPAHILVMSNGGFGGVHQRIIDALEQP